MSSLTSTRHFLGSEFPPEDFQQIRDILLERCHIDLNMYKDRCIKRRIAIRVRRSGFHSAADYARLLRKDEEELKALLEILTIHVSHFFRNPSTFAALEAIYLPRLLEEARREGRRRVDLWSVGCAGGEESYSLALLLEEIQASEVEINLLGTDISESVLERARRGFYEPQRLEEVPAAVLEKYFRPEGDGYRLKEELRKRVKYRCHDILRNTDYPRADLILCRNVLIYFSRSEQEKILARFALSLPADGILVLGKAETLSGAMRTLFRPVEPAERIYLRKEKVSCYTPSAERLGAGANT